MNRGATCALRHAHVQSHPTTIIMNRLNVMEEVRCTTVRNKTQNTHACLSAPVEQPPSQHIHENPGKPVRARHTTYKSVASTSDPILVRELLWEVHLCQELKAKRTQRLCGNGGMTNGEAHAHGQSGTSTSQKANTTHMWSNRRTTTGTHTHVFQPFLGFQS